MIKVSIIVPIYNTKKSLKKCIDSLINQTEKNIEIILINDGSTEDIDEIINLYDDKRIKYFKRTNHGIGCTRNYGINISNGEYLMFIDSDDYILSDCVSKMYEKAIKSNCDLVISDYLEERDGKTLIKSFIDFKDTSLKENSSLLNCINLGPCNKLYKKDLLTNNNIKFAEKLKYEDVPFVFKSLIFANKIGKINETLSVYVIHQNSETTTRDKKIFDILKISEIIIEESRGLDYLNKEVINLVVMILTDYTIQQRYIKNNTDRNKFIDEAFKMLNGLDKSWKKCKYLKKFSYPKRLVKSSKILTKIYCSVYNAIKNSN